MAYPGYRYSRYSRSRFRPRRSYPLYRRRFTRSRRYRPRGYRTSPLYSAFRQIRNIRAQEEVKYLDVQETHTFSAAAPTALIRFTANRFTHGTGPDEMIGRRVAITSITSNFTFTLPDSVAREDMPTFRVIAFVWKEGPIPGRQDLFTQEDPQGYWKDEYRFRKKTLLDRKFTMNPDHPVFQRTFRFKVPPRLITTPIDVSQSPSVPGYNNIQMVIFSNSPDRKSVV